MGIEKRQIANNAEALHTEMKELTPELKPKTNKM